MSQAVLDLVGPPSDPPLSGARPPLALYDYQLQAVEALRQNIRGGVKNQVLSAPTGSGKTIIATHLLAEALAKGTRAIFVCDRIPLIDQTSRTLDQYGIPHGVIQSNHWRRQPWSRIQVASAQTLGRRKWPEDLDLIIVDEAHSSYKTVTNRIAARDCVTIGLTATPFTRGMGKVYDAVVNVTTTRELIGSGYLAPYRIFAASEPDMTGVLVSKGEWVEKEAEARVLPIVGDCVAEYLKHGNDGKFIAFGVSVAHCEELQRQFLAAGIPTGLYVYTGSPADRQQMIEEFRGPDSYLRGLLSVSALAKGFDVADVTCIIMARPLRKSLTEHIQIFGRGLRKDPADPSKVCTILDHAGNTLRFWDRAETFFDEGATELDDGKPNPKKEAKGKKQAEPKKCPVCANVHAPRPMCPACGYEYPRESRVQHQAGELSEIGSGASASRDERVALYAQLLWIRREFGRKDGWVAYSYKERFGVWPRGMEGVQPAPPSDQVHRWVQSRDIAYAKGRRKSA